MQPLCISLTHNQTFRAGRINLQQFHQLINHFYHHQCLVPIPQDNTIPVSPSLMPVVSFHSIYFVSSILDRYYYPVSPSLLLFFLSIFLCLIFNPLLSPAPSLFFSSSLFSLLSTLSLSLSSSSPLPLLSLSSLSPLYLLSISSLSPLYLLSISSLSPLYLLSISSLSPLYLPSISPLSPLYLPSISPLSPLYLLSISPLSPLFSLLYISSFSLYGSLSSFYFSSLYDF
jgi:hypothetical protein